MADITDSPEGQSHSQVWGRKLQAASWQNVSHDLHQAVDADSNILRDGEGSVKHPQPYCRKSSNLDMRVFFFVIYTDVVFLAASDGGF